MAMLERGPDMTSLQHKPNAQSQITKELLEGYLYGKKKPRLVDLQSREMTNRKRKWNGVDDECSRKLQSLWCEECCKHIQGECPIHQLPQPKLTYAIGSFPPEVSLCTSTIPGYTYGACAAKPMPQGTWIGPYEGRRVYLTQTPKEKDNAYLWEIYENGKFSHFIDGSDESISSWMRFIRCARHKTEQNMSVIQYGNNIYYYAISDIEIGEEMLVWYHESYHQFWGVPLVLAKELDEKNGPPIPQGIQQPPPVKVTQTSSSNEPAINSSPASHSLNANAVTSRRPRKTSNSPEKLNIPQQYVPHKAFYYLQQITASKGSSPPSKIPYPPQLSPKSVPPDSSICPAAQHPPPPPGVLPYPPVSPTKYIPNVSPTHPPLSKGSIPYPPISQTTTPNPPQARNASSYTTMSHQSASFAYSSQSRYPPHLSGAIHYQPQTTLPQYHVRPTQSSPVHQMTPQSPYNERTRAIPHSMTPTKVQMSPETKRSPSVQSPVRETLHIPSSPQTPTGSQLVSPTVPSRSHIGRVVQQPGNHSPPAEQQLTTHSSREQAMNAFHENNNFGRTATVDRSLTLSEADQLAKAEVKENMPLVGTKDITIIETESKSFKHPQALKSSPLQNLTPSLHNKRRFEQADKQYNQVSSTVKCIKDKEQDISWKCGQCGEMFAQQVTLRMHVCSQAPDNPFHCGHCANTFATSAELREHVVTHSNDRPFKCGFCGRSFAGATTLGNHMRTHTGQRPYECKVCGQTFAIATQLSRHLKPPGECGLRQKEVDGFKHNVISVEQ